MTIDEVIRHCGKVAEEQEELYIICPASESEMSHCDGTKDCNGNINELHFCFSCGAKMDE